MTPFQEELFRLIQECKQESNAFTSSEEDSGNEVGKIIKFSQKWDFKEKHDKATSELAAINGRLEKELKIITDKVGKNFFRELVPLIDEFFIISKLVKVDTPEDRAVRIILTNLEKLLERKNGYIVKPKVGEEMNPTLHKVISAEQVVGHSGNTISEVYRYGYVVLDQVIREAHVKVKCGVVKSY